MSFAERYARQIALPEFGAEGQARLAAASVLCVGVGGLGSPASLYLCAAGVGRLGLLDPDVVAITDLHRQILHGTSELGLPKVHSARNALQRQNPETDVQVHAEELTPDNALDLLSRYDVILDCSDNFATRYLLNDACYFTQRPLVSGSVFQFGGQVTTFLRMDNGPCYRCLYPEPAPDDVVPPAEQVGVYGIAAGVIGLLQANEAIKVAADVGALLHGRLLVFEALSSEFRTVNVRKDVDCRLCGTNPTITGLALAE